MANINLSLHNLPNEIWKDVVGYEGLYLVSNKGRIKSLSHKIKRGFAECMTDEIILIPRTNGVYNKVCLSSGSAKSAKQRYIHRLVAEAFLPNPDNLPQVDHIDGNHTNNRLENLRWCTQSQNINNPITKYRSKKLRRIACFTLNGEFIKEYSSMTAASKDTGIPVSSICCIANNTSGMNGQKCGRIFKYIK